MMFALSPAVCSMVFALSPAVILRYVCVAPAHVSVAGMMNMRNKSKGQHLLRTSSFDIAVMSHKEQLESARVFH